jgi:tRNA(adenine34) deaminase
MNPPDHHAWTDHMRTAIDLGRKAADHGDVPVGAVIVGPEGTVVATGQNRREIDKDPTAHAEMLAIRAAAVTMGDWRLKGHTLVVNLEPCPMCAMAAVWARVDRVVYGAPDFKAGGVWSLFNIPQDERLNHRCEVIAGILGDETTQLLSEFFEARR